MINGVIRMRRELMIRLLRSYLAGTIDDDIDKIPCQLRPRDMASTRCCPYKDRAIIKYRLMALLGAAWEDEQDESRPLRDYLRDALAAHARPARPLTVCGTGCSGCEDGKYQVTDACRACFARPCTYNCPAQAISFRSQRAHIDQDACKNCGKCMELCPFHAITRAVVPCEEACPVGAIRKNAAGVAEIDFAACIFCGKCFAACPFAAILERSELLNIVDDLQRGRKLVALVAPSAAGQFPGSIGQLFAAMAAADFSDVIEVAIGAEMTTAHEAAEYRERMAAGARLLTTSCCPAYVEAAKKHALAIVPFISNTPSPMLYAAQIAREKHPEAAIVFIGPCIAKRHEATLHPGVIDWIMSFEELGALLAAKGIDVMSQPEWPMPRPAAASARHFARSCGVTEAVLKELAANTHDHDVEAKAEAVAVQGRVIDGITTKSVKQLQLYGLGKLPGNFLEVMACPGGCNNGPCSLSC